MGSSETMRKRAEAWGPKHGYGPLFIPHNAPAERVARAAIEGHFQGQADERAETVRKLRERTTRLPAGKVGDPSRKILHTIANAIEAGTL